MSVRVSPGIIRISRNVVWVFEPPSVCQVSFCQKKTCKRFGCTSCYTSCFRQIIYCCQQVREYGFGINLRYGVATEVLTGEVLNFSSPAPKSKGTPPKVCTSRK